MTFAKRRSDPLLAWTTFGLTHIYEVMKKIDLC